MADRDKIEFRLFNSSSILEKLKVTIPLNVRAVFWFCAMLEPKPAARPQRVDPTECGVWGYKMREINRCNGTTGELRQKVRLDKRCAWCENCLLRLGWSIRMAIIFEHCGTVLNFEGRVVNESYRTHEWVIPNTCMSHTERMHESWRTHELVIPHTQVSHVSQDVALWDMTLASHATHMNKSCLTH